MSADQPALPPVVAVAPAVAAAAGGDPYLAQRAAAEGLIVAGQLDQAQAALLALEADGHRDSQLRFLLGMVAAARHDYAEAIRRFRSILRDEPGLVRARLELGRVLFDSGDLRGAERQFRFARAGRALPDTVRRNIDRYLARIRQARTFTVGFSVAVAPDSNVNAGPTTYTVSLYGLPFELAREARASSGVGLASAVSIAWTPHLDAAWRWDFVAGGYTRQYRDARFGESAVSLATGPHLVRGRIDARLHATAVRRWYAGDIYAEGAGGAVDATAWLSGRTGVSVGLDVTRLTYPRFTAQSGTAYGTSVGVVHALGASSLGRAVVSWRRDAAADPGFANHAVGVDLGYVRELAGGITASLGARVRFTRYDAVLPAFGRLRRDTEYGGQATLVLRRAMVLGFAPQVTASTTVNDSTISLYSFRRSRIEFGVTRNF